MKQMYKEDLLYALQIIYVHHLHKLSLKFMY